MNEVDIFSIPLYYISFERNIEFEKKLKLIGFKYVSHFIAIDGKQFDPKKLVMSKYITIRTYNDLLTVRTQHTGIPSLGAIGCTLSHLMLWKKCLHDEYPYIIIVEDDANFNQPFTKSDIIDIKKCITRPFGIWMSTHVGQHYNLLTLIGTHFYIASKQACTQLVKYALPIDVQTDAYIAHIANMGMINLCDGSIVSQSFHISTIQNACVKCYLPDHTEYYIIFLLLLHLLYTFIDGFFNSNE